MRDLDTQATTTATRRGSLRYLSARATTNDEKTTKLGLLSHITACACLLLQLRTSPPSCSNRRCNTEPGQEPSTLLRALHIGKELLPGIRNVKSQIVEPIPDP